MGSSSTRQYFLLLLLAGSGFLTFSIISPFFNTLVLAIVFATVLQPIYQRLRKVLKNRNQLAALATIVLTLIFVLGPLFFLASQVFFEAQRLYQTVTQDEGNKIAAHLISKINTPLHHAFPMVPKINLNISQYTVQISNWILLHVGPFFSRVAQWGIATFIFLIALYFLLCEGKKLKELVMELSPLTDKENETIAKRLTMAITMAIRGNLLVALVQGVVASIGFTLFGLPNPILWGSITAIAALIPSLGTSLVIGPSILYLFLTHHPFSAAGLLIWGIAGVGLIDNFLYPKLVGKGIQMHSFFVLISVLGGLSLFGPIGFILGPLCLSLFFALIDIYRDFA